MGRKRFTPGDILGYLRTVEIEGTYRQNTQHPLLKYRGTQPPNFQKQIYNRFYGERAMGGNDVSS